jgi:hypothetical protein
LIKRELAGRAGGAIDVVAEAWHKLMLTCTPRELYVLARVSRFTRDVFVKTMLRKAAAARAAFDDKVSAAGAHACTEACWAERPLLSSGVENMHYGVFLDHALTTHCCCRVICDRGPHDNCKLCAAPICQPEACRAQRMRKQGVCIHCAFMARLRSRLGTESGEARFPSRDPPPHTDP